MKKLDEKKTTKSEEEFTAEEMRMREISTRMKNKRLERGMSLQELANLTGITKSTLSRYENGNIRNMPFGKISDVARALGVSEEWLLGNSFRQRSFTLLDNILCKILKEDPRSYDFVEDFVVSESFTDLRNVLGSEDDYMYLRRIYIILNKHRRKILLKTAEALLDEQDEEIYLEEEGQRDIKEADPNGND